MSLNHKEIDQVLSELPLGGSLLQSVRQSSFHQVILGFYQPGNPFSLLIDLSSNSPRIHETKKSWPKPAKPLRFAQLITARILGSRVVQALQVDMNRIVKILLEKGSDHFILWVRLWGGSGNFIITDGENRILDAQYRRPASGEIPGLEFKLPLPRSSSSEKEYALRELPGEGSYNQRLEAFFSSQGPEDLEALRHRTEKILRGQIRGFETLEVKARQRQAEYLRAWDYKVYGDLIMAQVHALDGGAEFLDTVDYRDGCSIRIPLDPKLSGVENAQGFYKKHSKGKSGLELVEKDLASYSKEILDLQKTLEKLPSWGIDELKNFLKKQKPEGQKSTKEMESSRPGLEFESGGFTLWVGRNARENDELLRRWVKGKDTWFHVRNTSGGYVFVLGQRGKTIPLEILLDAGALAVHFSKARGEQISEVYYTEVKYLRRVKNGPLGMVIPTQEKNLVVRWDPQRLQRLMKKDDSHEGP